MRRARSIAACIAVAVAVTACTGDDPETAASPSASPTSSPTAPVAEEEPQGIRVAVVLPVTDRRPLDAGAVRAAVGALRVATRDTVPEYRVLQPDGPEFVGDLVDLLAGEGYDLVCAVGSGVAPVVLEVARDHPTTRFCAWPAGPEEPSPANVHLLDVRVGEAAYLAGAAAAEGISPPAELDDEPPTALQPGIVGDPTAPDGDRQAGLFEAGLRRRIARDVEVTFGVPGADAASTAEQTRFILEAGGEVVFGTVGSSVEGLLQGAAGLGSVVALVDGRAELPASTPELLATVSIDLAPVLTAVVDGLVSGAAPEWRSFGAAEGIFAIGPGGSPRAAQAAAAAEAALEDLRSGRVTLP